MKVLAILVIFLSLSGTAFSQPVSYDVTKEPLPYSDIIRNYQITYTSKINNTTYKANPDSELFSQYRDFDDARNVKAIGYTNMPKRDSAILVTSQKKFFQTLDEHATISDPISELLDLAQLKVLIVWLHKNNKLLGAEYEKEIGDISQRYEDCKSLFPKKLASFMGTKKTDPANIIIDSVDKQLNTYVGQIRAGK